jgi:hypothetical protein
MGPLDSEYQKEADRCREMANRAPTDYIKEAWLQLAAKWSDMLHAPAERSAAAEPEAVALHREAAWRSGTLSLTSDGRSRHRRRASDCQCKVPNARSQGGERSAPEGARRVGLTAGAAKKRDLSWRRLDD